MTDTSSDQRLIEPAPIRTLHLGRVTVSYIPDGFTPLNARKWFPGTTDEFWAEHAEYLNDDEDLIAPVRSLLVQSEGRAMLIDAGFGRPFGLREFPTPFGTLQGGAMFDSLAKLDVEASDIEVVALTHLDGDHVGGLWQLAPGASRLPFANATVVVSADEWARPDLAEERGTLPLILDAFASQVSAVGDGDEIFPGVRVVALPGHSIGHVGYVISSGGRRLIAFGDAMHSPIQIGHPDLAAVVDYDPAQSTETRRWLINELARPDTLGFGGHFPNSPFGRVKIRSGAAFWDPQL
ncbi:MBL fold metallo-hydrolase [Nocardia sp. NPDC050710]|uniref:MBL fold metallo-hydrolase n=1 Tax=Nocardia sp. NPDC050710 TaxID=3157220 RepID=UPI0033D40C82